MLDWRGESVARAAMDAMVDAAEEAVDDAVAESAANTPVLTGEAAGSVRRESRESLELVDPSTLKPARIVWGYHVRYGIFIEIGDRGRPGQQALRRAADSHYPRILPMAAARFGR